MKFIYLGKEKISVKHNNVYHYVFNNVILESKNVILEKDYLTPKQIKCSYNHLAEFGAFYVFWKYNPINLKDDDIICLVSARKFENLTGFGHDNVFNFEPIITKYLNESPAIYSFTHHNKHDVNKNIDYCLMFSKSNFLFNIPKLLPYIKHIRNKFDNYSPHPGRHYFCYKYDNFKIFCEWVYNNLFKIFFNDDFSEKIDNDGKSIIGKIQPAKYAYNPQREFGLIMEHFHQRFFYDTGNVLYWHPFQEKNPNFIYKQKFINSNSDWNIKKIIL